MRTCGIAVQQVVIAHHNLHCRCGRSRQIEELCNAYLNEIVSVIPIDKDNDAVVRDMVVDAEGFCHRHPEHCVGAFRGDRQKFVREKGQWWVGHIQRKG